ncbi:MAG: hypothetical protein IJV45_06770 [Prevotella sp.]|nr:hypothetical protein [Prevotella sp.]
MMTMKPTRLLFLASLLALSMGFAGCGGDDDDEPVDPTPVNPVDPTPGQEEDEDAKWNTPAAVRYKSFRGLAMAGYQAWYNAAGD